MDAGTPLILQNHRVLQNHRDQACAQDSCTIWESEAWFRSLLDDVPVMLWAAATDGACTFFNQGWLNFTGRSLAQELGNGWMESVHPDDRQECLEICQRTFAAREPFEKEYRLRRADGVYRWILDRGTARFTSDGEFMGFIGSCIDISDRKATETILHETVGRNRALLSAIPDLLLLVEKDGTCVEFIPPNVASAGKFLPIQSHLSEVLPPELVSFQLARMQESLTTGELQIWEHQFYKHDELSYEEVRISPCGDDRCLVIVRDITDRRRLEKNLIESDERYRQIVESQTEFVMRSRADTTMTFANTAFCRALGRSATEICGKPWREIVPLADVEILGSKVVALSPTCPTFDSIILIQRVDGQMIWTQWSNLGIFDDRGELLEIQSVGRDITAMRVAEMELQASEQRYRLLAKNIRDMVCLHDRDGRYLFVSPSCEPLLGYTYDELVGQDPYAFFHPDDRDRTRREFQALALSEEPILSVYRMGCKDGNYIWFETLASPIRNTSGEVVQILTTSRDVSDRKHGEELLRRYERIVSATPDCIALLGTNYIYQIANQTFLNWYAKSAEEIIGRSLEDLIGKKCFEKVSKPMFDRCLAGESQQTFEAWFTFGDGRRRFAKLTYTPFYELDGSITGVLVNIHDLTQLKQAEESLRQHQLQLQTLIQNAPVILYEIDRDGIFTLSEGRGLAALNLQSGEVVGRSVYDVFADYPQVTTGIQKALAGNLTVPWITEVNDLVFENRVTLLRGDRHEIAGLIGVATDFTERSRAEEALRRQLLQTQVLNVIVQLIHYSFDLNAIFNTATSILGGFLEVDRVAIAEYLPEQQSWQPHAEFRANKGVPSFLGEIELPYHDRAIAERVLLGETIYVDPTSASHAETYSEKHDAVSHRLFQRYGGKWTIVPLEVENRIWGAISVDSSNIEHGWNVDDLELVRSIANQVGIAIQQASLYNHLQQELKERKRAEETLQRISLGTASATGEDFFARLVENLVSALGVRHAVVSELVGDRIHTLAFWSESTTDIGSEIGDSASENLWQVLSHERLQQEFNIESSLGVVMRDRLGKVLGNICILDDKAIDDADRAESLLQIFAARAAAELERRNAQIALEQVNLDLERKVEERTMALLTREAELRGIFELAAVGIVQADAVTGSFLKVNQKFCDILGYAEVELIGKTFLDITHRDDRLASKAYIDRLQSGEIVEYTIEKRYIHCNGGIVWVSATVSLMCRPDGTPAYRIAIVQEITDRKKTEEQLQRSLLEKETLLKEIHHRVKNNLQIVTSLIRLQSSQIEDVKLLGPFLDSQNRIQTMALIHEHLYESQNLARIDYSSYLKALVNQLFQTYATQRPRLRYQVEVDAVVLDLDRAIPCGLIVCELVSNALKYAFPPEQGGTVRVEMYGRAESYCLLVTDDGIGLPGNFDVDTISSLGLRLVTGLVEQLDGTLEVVSRAGTVFAIRFPMLKNSS